MYQVNLIRGGDNEFNLLCYGEQHPNTMNFLANQVSALPSLSSTLQSGMETFFDRARDIYEQFNSSDALRKARAVFSQVAHVFQVDTIRPLFNLEDIQQAPLTMQRWIMAEPQLRALYHDNLCDGFSSSYIDMNPGDIGEAHYDYRRVMQGIVVDHPDPDTGWVATTYLDEIHEGDRELDIAEQIDVQSTWEMIRMFVDRKENDPTSIWNSSL